MLATEQFVKLIQNKHIQVKIKLKELSSTYEAFGVEVREYSGKEKEIWCEIESINSFSSLSYKVFCKPIKNKYKGKEFYTIDLLRLIDGGIIKLRILYDEEYNNKIIRRCK
ncbi:hypothetical protein MCG45_15975 [Clostridium perfringens]|uniref:hypothetical protein n=1 Tax=Clostridium perfringens TaxID=1502 RepID=UPI001F0547C1|nr:hypothetical protein [Clostridium perfringens]MCH1964327.1 hypothetical protein [Clostridium perfringens]